MIFRIIPLEAGIGILWWIGIIIVAQAFQEIPKPHALAVAVGLFPALAAWGLLMIESALRCANTTIYALGKEAFKENLAIHGIISLERGFIFTSMILAATCVFLIEHQFLKAAYWILAAAGLSYIGIIHAYELTPFGIVSKFGFGAANQFAFCYLLIAALFIGMHYWLKRGAKL